MGRDDVVVTLEHIRKAAEWAQACLDKKRSGRGGRLPIDGHLRRYDQATWDCGTACCIWGAAHLLATGEPSPAGPSYFWPRQSALHCTVWLLLLRPSTEPADVLAVLK